MYLGHHLPETMLHSIHVFVYYLLFILLDLTNVIFNVLLVGC